MTDSIYTQSAYYAHDRPTQWRISAAWVQQARLGEASDPPTDPLAEVIGNRWRWSSEWGTIDTETGVSDGQVRDAVKTLWPTPVVEEPPVE